MLEKSPPSSGWEKFRGFVALACLLFGLFFTGIGLFFVKKGMDTDAWTRTSGRIDSSNVTTKISRSSGNSGSSLVDVADIQYSFDAGGLPCQGTRISTFDLRLGRNTDRAKALVAEYPVGKDVDVYYDPLDVNRSLLVPGARPGAWTMTGVGVGLMMLFFMIPGAAPRQKSRSAPGPAQVNAKDAAD